MEKKKYFPKFHDKKNLNSIDLSFAENIEFQLNFILEKLITKNMILKEKSIDKALLFGFFLNTAKLRKNKFYYPVFSKYKSSLEIYPRSIMNNLPYKANLILFDHLNFGIKIFMNIITIIKIENIKKFSLIIFNSLKV